MLSPFFFFNDTATTEIYPLSLHDALPIYQARHWIEPHPIGPRHVRRAPPQQRHRDRKSTRLNSSHDQISYAVFCLKKKKKYQMNVLPELNPAIVPPSLAPAPSIAMVAAAS